MRTNVFDFAVPGAGVLTYMNRFRPLTDHRRHNDLLGVARLKPSAPGAPHAPRAASERCMGA